MRDAQLKKGIEPEKVMVRSPNHAWTFEIQLWQNMPVSVPVCLDHLGYKEESRLLGG
jgi:hypothetical protein